MILALCSSVIEASEFAQFELHRNSRDVRTPDDLDDLHGHIAYEAIYRLPSFDARRDKHAVLEACDLLERDGLAPRIQYLPDWRRPKRRPWPSPVPPSPTPADKVGPALEVVIAAFSDAKINVDDERWDVLCSLMFAQPEFQRIPIMVGNSDEPIRTDIVDPSPLDDVRTLQGEKVPQDRSELVERARDLGIRVTNEKVETLQQKIREAEAEEDRAREVASEDELFFKEMF